jgi:hypothetical protein
MTTTKKEKPMTNQRAQTIAAAAVTVRALRHQLAEAERLGHTKQARTLRTDLNAAEAALDQALATAE